MAAKFPEQKTIFVSWKRSKDLNVLSDLLVSMCPLVLLPRLSTAYSTDMTRYRSGTPAYTRIKCAGRWHAQCRQVHAVELIKGYRYPWPWVSSNISCIVYLRLVHACLATPKALRTSAQPGLTKALSTRLKLSEDPLVYSYDTPGVMLPFLGHGTRGAERGVKLALIGMRLPL